MRRHEEPYFADRGALTQKALKLLLAYDRRTGRFTWRSARYGFRRGDVAGGLSGDGYWRISVNGHRYRAHRLAWLYVHGKWPTNQIDHRNGDRKDNRIANLRDVSQRENCMNSAHHRDSKSAVKGVFFSRGKWRSEIRYEGFRACLGAFETKAEAIHVRRVFEKRLFGKHRRGT